MADIFQEIDPTNICMCDPCQRFWQDLLKSSSFDGSVDGKTLGKLRPPTQVSVGDRVSVHGKTGSVKYVGFVDDKVLSPVLRVGIKLDESTPEGHDGMYQGRRYFHCLDGHAIFARMTDVLPLKTANRRPPVRGNSMFPSWPDVYKKRKDQQAKQEELEKKRSKMAALSSLKKSPKPPPSITPRANRATLMRREMICMAKLPGAYLMFRQDPKDMAFRDQHGRKSDMLVACLPSPRDRPQTWKRGPRKQWHDKYDPEKVDRMQETLLKLYSAYQEGMKHKHLHAD